MTPPDYQAPLVPADCDLLNFLRMPLQVGRLLSSNTWIEAGADPRLGHVLISLWAESWRQVPAGSLPDNDKTLQRLSMCPSTREWQRIKAKALAGWVRCSDGRLYHPVVCEMALECWLEKLGAQLLAGAGNAKRHGYEFDSSALETARNLAASLLQALNPNSQALKKLAAKNKASGKVPTGRQGGGGASLGGPDAGLQNLPAGARSDPAAIPTGSQGNRREGITPKAPAPQPVDNFDHREPQRLPNGAWWDSRQGIEDAGQALQVGRWDEWAFRNGTGEQWPTYRARVLQAAGDGPWARALQPTPAAVPRIGPQLLGAVLARGTH
jgi:hypothetical protein